MLLTDAETVADAIAAGAVGERLWLYTNYHCNLQCVYCLTSSGPRVARRLLDAAAILDLADDAVRLGFRSFGVTGGEPFLRADMPSLLEALASRLPVVVLTNGTLFTQRFVDERLAPMAGARIAVQVSLDSADAQTNDALRGAGTHARVVAGMRRLVALGMHVRVGTTAELGDEDLAALCALHRELGIGEADHVVRPVIARGRARRHGLGIAAEREDVPAELTVTADGAFWSPAGPTVEAGRLDQGDLLTRTTRPLDVAAAAMVRFAAAGVPEATGRVV